MISSPTASLESPLTVASCTVTEAGRTPSWFSLSSHTTVALTSLVSLTSTWAVAVAPSHSALIATVPIPTPVTVPLSSTVAIEVPRLVHLIVGFST